MPIRGPDWMPIDNLYTGHFWHHGWSIVDVSDPRNPHVERFIEGPRNTATLQVTLFGDTLITALEKILPGFGGDEDAPFEEGVLVWDISNPIDPRKLSHWRTGGTGTHRNLYAGGRYALLAANMAGFKGNIYIVLDIGDRENPREVGRWWVPGQKDGEAPTQRAEPEKLITSKKYGLQTFATCGCMGFCTRPGTDGVSLHGPPYPIGNTVYLPYGAAGLIVLDIKDVTRPEEIGRLSFSPPFHSSFGVHSALPIPERSIAFANSEDISYGQGPGHHASIIDISDPSDPWLLSVLPEPVPPPDAPHADFYTRGGWCGPHNINHNQYHPDVDKHGNLFYIAHFNAGLRIYDVSNKILPIEVGYFLPPEPHQRFGQMPQQDCLADRGRRR